MLSDPSILIVLVPIIGTVVVNIIIALKTNDKISEVSAKADVITGHVNSAATAANAKIDAMEKEIIALKQLVVDDKEKAALLAQVAALTQASNLIPPNNK